VKLDGIGACPNARNALPGAVQRSGDSEPTGWSTLSGHVEARR